VRKGERRREKGRKGEGRKWGRGCGCCCCCRTSTRVVVVVGRSAEAPLSLSLLLFVCFSVSGRRVRTRDLGVLQEEEREKREKRVAEKCCTLPAYKSERPPNCVVCRGAVVVVRVVLIVPWGR